MFDAKRLQERIQDAKSTVETCENIALEKACNFKFNPSDFNKSQLEWYVGRVAESRNYLETLEAMLEARNEKPAQTTEDVKHQFARLLA